MASQVSSSFLHSYKDLIFSVMESQPLILISFALMVGLGMGRSHLLSESIKTQELLSAGDKRILSSYLCINEKMKSNDLMDLWIKLYLKLDTTFDVNKYTL